MTGKTPQKLLPLPRQFGSQKSSPPYDYARLTSMLGEFLISHFDLAQQRPHRRDVCRFHQVMVEFHLLRMSIYFVLAISRHRHKGWRLVAHLRTQALCHFVAVHAWQADVKENDLRL